MATRNAIAAKRATAIDRLEAGLPLIAQKLGIDTPPDLPMRAAYRKLRGGRVEMLQAKQLEGMADWVDLIIQKMGWKDAQNASGETRESGVIDTPPDFEQMDYRTLKALAESRGIKTIGVSREKLILALRQGQESKEAIKETNGRQDTEGT